MNMYEQTPLANIEITTIIYHVLAITLALEDQNTALSSLVNGGISELAQNLNKAFVLG